MAHEFLAVSDFRPRRLGLVVNGAEMGLWKNGRKSTYGLVSFRKKKTKQKIDKRQMSLEFGRS